MKQLLQYIVVLFVLISPSVLKANVNDTLFIQRDTVNFGSILTHFCVFNSDTIYDPGNTVIQANVGEAISTTVINRDSLPHTFTIEGVITTGNIILPGDTATFNYSFSNQGSYRYYSDQTYGHWMGAAGQVLIGYQNHPRFFWNLFEQQSSISSGLADQSVTSLPSNFFADVYTINGRIYPDVTNDTTAVVMGNVGDSIVISIVNNGKMSHSLHFHGYHITILNDSKRPERNGWIKDTFPIDPNETCVILLVPHQPGMYPVHDHNLFAVNTGGYPGGMITRLMISP